MITVPLRRLVHYLGWFLTHAMGICWPHLYSGSYFMFIINLFNLGQLESFSHEFKTESWGTQRPECWKLSWESMAVLLKFMIFFIKSHHLFLSYKYVCFAYMCVFARMYALCSLRLGEGVESPELELPKVVSLCVSAENQTWILLCKRSKCS